MLASSEYLVPLPTPDGNLTACHVALPSGPYLMRGVVVRGGDLEIMHPGFWKAESSFLAQTRPSSHLEKCTRAKAVALVCLMIRRTREKQNKGKKNRKAICARLRQEGALYNPGACIRRRDVTSISTSRGIQMRRRSVTPPLPHTPSSK